MADYESEYSSIMNDYESILQFVPKQIEAKSNQKKNNQHGGIRFCDTADTIKQFLYNFWGHIITLLFNKYNKYDEYNDYHATRGETTHANATCNMWIWRKRDQIDNLTNHMDVFMINSEKIGIKFTKQTFNNFGNVMTYTDVISFEIPDVNTYDAHYVINDKNSSFNGIDPMPVIADMLHYQYQRVFGQ